MADTGEGGFRHAVDDWSFLTELSPLAQCRILIKSTLDLIHGSRDHFTTSVHT